MSKFHVGDRWADQKGDEWWLYQLDTDGEVRGVRVDDGVSHWFRDGRNNLYKLELTRLISSERWIPFAEMMPAPPQPGEKRVVVAYVEDEEDPYLFRVCGGQWVASDEFADWSLSELTPDGAHWRYLQPPEAS